MKSSTSNEKKVINDKTGGAKGAKPQRFDLFPPEPLWEVAELYGIGAAKYDDEDGVINWTKGYNWSLSYAAMQRHLQLFWSGEDFDVETGKSHLAAVMFHALTLRLFMEEYPEFDDRQFKRFNKDLPGYKAKKPKSKKNKKKGKKN